MMNRILNLLRQIFGTLYLIRRSGFVLMDLAFRVICQLEISDKERSCSPMILVDLDNVTLLDLRSHREGQGWFFDESVK